MGVDARVGLHTLRLAVETHAITSHFAIGADAEDAGRAGRRSHRRHRRVQREPTTGVSFFYDHREGRRQPHGVRALARVDALHGRTVVDAHSGLVAVRADADADQVTEANWLDAQRRSSRTSRTPSHRLSSAAAGSWRSPPTRMSRASERSGSVERAARAGLRLHRSRRQPARRVAYLVEVQDKGLPADVTGYR